MGTASDSFVRLVLEKNTILLKIDFVNDVKFHKGNLEKHPLFHRIDNWSNILSNKLCAISRLDVKDIVDILFISKNHKFDWKEIIKDAREKDLIEVLIKAIGSIHDDIFFGHENSLCP